MQCVNCGFENIPGMQLCVRCQSSLELAAAVIAPPRAGRYHLGSRLRRLWNGIGPALRRIGQYRVDWRLWFRPRGHARWDAVVLSALLPGLGNICYKSKIIGCLLLATWLGCLVPGLMMYGSDLCVTLMSIAMFTHALAILLPMGRTLVEGTFQSRCLTGLAVFAGLLFCLYLPAEWTIRRFWSVLPLNGIAPNSMFSPGQTLLVEGPWRRSTTYSRGDIVLYQIHRVNGDHVHVYEGFGLDRVLGVPGDTVAVKGGHLLVNGQPVGPDRQPLGNVPRYGDMEIQAGPDRYVILPTTLEMGGHGDVDPVGLLIRVSRIPPADIVGRVTFRTYPWSARGPIR